MGNQNNFNEIAVANKKAQKLHLILAVILFIAYVLEFIKGKNSIGLTVLLTALLFVPCIISRIVYKKNEMSLAIKHIVGVGYGIFYLVNCFTSTERTVFIYSIPMLMVVAMFCDLKFSVLVSSIIGAIALVHGIYMSYLEAFSSDSIGALEVEVAGMAVILVYSVITNMFIIQLNNSRMAKINEATEKTDKMLTNVMEVSGELASDVTKVSEMMEQLAESSQETLSAMTEVQSGTSDSAEAVQNQLVKTEEISGQISKVTEASATINSCVDDATVAIEEGRKNITELISQAQKSEAAGNSAIKEVEELKKSTDQMQTIVELIQEVASQTSLLSLNASIEAARAGEAGRGFAVVASEISHLAGQTQTATGNINALIESITKEMGEVSGAITSLVESNKVQNESAQITAGSFEKIYESSDSIKKNANDLAKTVSSLDAANREIIESIQTISAITEEVSAHSTTTCDTSAQNEKIVRDVQSVVENMTANADKLKNL